MKTAVDSSVLLDVLGGDTEFGPASREALRGAYDAGVIVACEVVWAEIRANFDSEDSFAEALTVLGVQFEAIGPEAAALAGRLWREHSRRIAKARDRVIADFLVGAHAAIGADVLLTRDRGFFRRCFSNLKVADPSRP